MKGLFIPEITSEMFRNGCLESIETLMAEGEIYDIDYSPWTPVSEGPPKEDGDYLTYIIDPDDPKWSYIMTAHYETPNCFEPSGCWSHDVDLVSDNVVCWMPLPKVPLEIIDKEMAKLKGEKNEQS